VELGVIVSLAGWLYSTYLNNIYFQTYVDSLSPVLVPILSVTFGISSASIATYLYLGMKRIRTLQEPEVSVKKRAHPRKTPKHSPQPPASPPKVADLQTMPAKLKPISPSQSHIQKPKPPLKEIEDHNSGSENMKQP